MLARFFFSLFLKLFARRLVRSAYRGILGRAPDAAGLNAYAKELSSRRDLAWVLADLADSDEARRRAGLGAPEDLVRTAFAAILRRSPQPEELAAHVARLKETLSVDSLLLELSAGRAHTGKFAVSEAEELVQATFKALLQRAPEPEALAAYTHLLVETGDMARFIAEISTSQEHRERLSAAGRRARALARA
jgi:hypothetical protein